MIEEMVNNIVDCYPDNEQVHLKETKIQFQIRSINPSEQVRTLRFMDKNEKLDQLNSIENIDLSNDCEAIKRTKLNDDDLFDFIDKAETLLDNETTNGQMNVSELSSYLAGNEVSNENLSNENQYLNCTPENALERSDLISEFENSIELNESDCNNQLNNTFSTQETSLQNDPFLSFLPYHHFTATTTPESSQQLNTTSTSTTSTNATITCININNNNSNCGNNNNKNTESTNQLFSLTKLLLNNNQDNGQEKHPQTQFGKSGNNMRTGVDQSTLDNQTDLFQQFNNHNSPSDYIKIDQDNEQINKSIGSTCSTIQSSPISSIESVDSIINEKRLISSQKLSGDDLLFSLTSEDLNEVGNYFPLLNTDLTKEKFNCSPSLDSFNSGDSMFCSSVFDSPPPSSTSSNNSSLNNDLPFILGNDSDDLSTKQANEREDFLDLEFPFLSEDSIFDSFINSNLNDLINTNEFFNEKCTLNDDLQFENNNLNGFLNACSVPNFPCFNSFNSDHATLPKTRKPHCTLSKDSNLAKLLLLKEKLPVKLPPQSNNQTHNNQAKSSNDNHLTSGSTKSTRDDSSTVNSNQTNESTKCSTTKSTPNSIVNNLTTSTGKEVDLKNSLITRKFTIQSLNVNTNDKISTGCLPRSIKIIDPVQVATGSGNVKYLVNNISTQNGGQTTTTGNSFSLNLTPANCLTVTTTGATSTSLANGQLNAINSTTTTTANLSTTKSFIIKSVDGKFANGILYTPIARNGQPTNIAYTSNLNANMSTINGQTVNQGDKTKIMATFPPNSLFINNRKLVQKRPYSSMSVSLSSTLPSTTSNTQTRDLYSIDLVPKQQFTTTTIQDDLQSELTSSEMKKKMKTLDTTNTSSSTVNKNYTNKLPTNSVLLNLLLNGEDVNNGYLKSNTYKPRCNQPIYNKSHARIV